MRLLTFRDNSGERVGILENDTVLDVTAALPRSMLEVISKGRESAVAELSSLRRDAPKLSLSSVRVCAPIPRPAKNIFCVGKNYVEHAKEFANSGFDATSKSAIPEFPIIFTKAPTTVIGPYDPIPGHLDHSNSVDYENELAVVIGSTGRHIKRADALKHVFGYTIINDVTARTLQHRHVQWFVGKNIDGFCPMGPVIVTADEMPAMESVRVITTVNGELRQDAPASDLIFDVQTLIETISATMTLEPGDIIATGTPPGVGIGFSPPKFLKTGDVVVARIDPIGELRNAIY